VPALIALLALACLVACEGGKGGGVPTDGPGGSGIQCGGFAGTECPPDEMCDFFNNTCGDGDQTGICVAKPINCNTLFDPVCACDGQVHGNACSARAAGFDLNASGFCEADPGTFTCGFEICNLDTQFCARSPSDDGGIEDAFTCVTLPSGCGSTPTCACLSGETCGRNCSGDASVGLTIVCPAG
jgi:hypothetical protein